MKKNYVSPEIKVSVINCEDIMLGSDTDIDISPLWGEE